LVGIDVGGEEGVGEEGVGEEGVGEEGGKEGKAVVDDGAMGGVWTAVVVYMMAFD
jgi:hypothetical protein